MSEDVPPYLSRQFVCRTCGRTFEPSAREAEALAEFQRTFGLAPETAEALCEDCAGHSRQ